jgi:exosortase
MLMVSSVRRWLLPFALLGLLLWAYWPTLAEMAERWADDPQYSHGYLVPIFSLYLLWSRRELLTVGDPQPTWWGVAFLLAGIGLRGVGTFFYFGWFDAISLLFCLAGLALVAGGWRALRWSWPAILFLGFMAPLPYRFQIALGGTLQRVATHMSTYALQTLGAPAVSEGNIILLNDVRIGVVEACNGLGMLVTFFALATAVAMLLRSGGWWLRLIVILSAVPVAILANVVRITATGLLYDAAQTDAARIVFHDVAGWLMMPLAVLVLLLEVHVLRRLVVERKRTERQRGPVPMFPGAAPAAAAR